MLPARFRGRISGGSAVSTGSRICPRVRPAHLPWQTWLLIASTPASVVSPVPSGARYTRYADDLAFSGGEELARALERVIVAVGAIALEEGFAVQHRKTRVMRRGVRQRVTGVVINAHPNVARDTYDTLKATLHNCVRHGPAAENRGAHPDFRAHLAGRVAHVVLLNPARGGRLQALFERIVW